MLGAHDFFLCVEEHAILLMAAFELGILCKIFEREPVLFE